MVWSCRYLETHSYRPILKDYFRRGARWAAAPKPQLTDEPFDAEFRVPEKGEPISYILTEFEPVFVGDFLHVNLRFLRCSRASTVMRCVHEINITRTTAK
jgi:hypothetical protein